MRDEEVTYSDIVADLDGFEEAAEEVIGVWGGSITVRDERSIRFALPRRRGDDSAGALSCVLTWEREGEGVVRLTSDGEIEGSRAGRIALLLVGTAGSLAFIFWPFFPQMGTIAAVGLVVAIAVYMLTLRRSPHGLVGSLLHEIISVHHGRLRHEAAENS